MGERQGYDEEVLPSQTSDDTDTGWGEDSGEPGEGARDGSDDDPDIERLLREKPPHW